MLNKRNTKKERKKTIFGSSRINGGAVFLRILTVAYDGLFQVRLGL